VNLIQIFLLHTVLLYSKLVNIASIIGDLQLNLLIFVRQFGSGLSFICEAKLQAIGSAAYSSLLDVICNDDIRFVVMLAVLVELTLGNFFYFCMHLLFKLRVPCQLCQACPLCLTPLIFRFLTCYSCSSPGDQDAIQSP
jgi:hypothetical protein